MQFPSASRITIQIGVVQDRNLIKMFIDEAEYVMLTAKRAPYASGIITQLDSHFGVKAVPGMAFDYDASIQNAALTIHPEQGVIGVYVRSEDAKKVQDLFNR